MIELGINAGKVQPELGGLSIGGASVSDTVVTGGVVGSDTSVVKGAVYGRVIADGVTVVG